MKPFPILCPGQHFVSSFDLPVSARILGATPAHPYLGVRLRFNPISLRSLIEEAQLPTLASGVPDRGVYVSPTMPALLDAVLRLVRLLQFSSGDSRARPDD